MIELRATYINDIYRSADSTYAVCRIGVEGKLQTAVGEIPALQYGTPVVLTGVWETSQRYGTGFRVSGVLPDVPEENNLPGIAEYLTRKAFKIGKVTATAVIEAFKERTAFIIENRPDLLLEVPGVGEERAAKIHDAWVKDKKLRKTLVFLYGLGLTQRVVGRILLEFGQSAEVVIRENPYALTEIDGVSFQVADSIALGFGLAKDNPQRVQAGVTWAMDHIDFDGHCALPLVNAIDEASSLLQVDAETVVNNGITPAIEAGELCVHDVHSAGNGCTYLQRPWLDSAERGVAQSIQRIQEEFSSKYDTETPEVPIDVSAGGSIKLSEEQQGAIRDSLSREGGVLVITGGPGTGKTTIIKGILAVHGRNKHIVLCAPTGRAAKRMEEATERTAKTVHRVLGYTKAGWTYCADNPLSADIVIVDEASMLDLSLTHALTDALESSCRLILVGDVDQLPSVGQGNVLKDIIQSGAVRTRTLTRIYRQGLQSMIVSNAHRINSGMPPTWEPEEDQFPDMTFSEARGPESLQYEVTQAMHALLGEGYLRGDIQVLSPMNKGDYGTTALNAFLQDLFNKHGEDVKKGIRVGDRVIHTKNNYQLGVYNGDIGTVVEGPSDGTTSKDTSTLPSEPSAALEDMLVRSKKTVLTVKFPDKDQAIRYPAQYAEQLKLAYAISIHKSQGSEYPAIIIVLHDAHSIMLARNLFYTAVTRGKRRVHVIGTKTAAARAAANNRISRRITLLRERLLGKVPD